MKKKSEFNQLKKLPLPKLTTRLRSKHLREKKLSEESLKKNRDGKLNILI